MHGHVRTRRAKRRRFAPWYRSAPSRERRPSVARAGESAGAGEREGAGVGAGESASVSVRGARTSVSEGVVRDGVCASPPVWTPRMFGRSAAQGTHAPQTFRCAEVRAGAERVLARRYVHERLLHHGIVARRAARVDRCGGADAGPSRRADVAGLDGDAVIVARARFVVSRRADRDA